MVRLPKCVSCIHCNIWKIECSIYPQGIPNNIFLERSECDKYEPETDTDVDESLPIAKGR